MYGNDDTRKESDMTLRELIKKEVEAIIEKYCDGAFNGLARAHFLEWSSDGSANPQKCADEIVEAINSLLLKKERKVT